MFKDLREFIEKADELGECRLIEGADWDLEIGAITGLRAEQPGSPLLLFDKIKGYPAGYRVATNLTTSDRRIALSYGLPLEARGMDLTGAFRDRLKEGIRPIPPVEVATAPVKENVLVGDEVDLFRFPTPKWHELDAGRFIGTGSSVVTRDPDEGWVNIGTYNVAIHDKNTATVAIGYGHRGYVITRKYWAKGQACPMAVCCGQAPIVFAATHFPMPEKMSEYDWAGGWQGEPVEVTRGVTTDLPIPATAEIVLEGEMVPPEVETRPDGPFGEWVGYYTAKRMLPAFRVKSILHRNSPIIQGNMPHRLPRVWTPGLHIQMAAALWKELDAQIPGVTGVAMLEDAPLSQMVVIALKQLYGGHAKQAALVAAGSPIVSYLARYIIVVDEDIDPTDISKVLWAISSRSEPSEIEVTSGVWGSWGNPRLTPEQRKKDDRTHTIGTILACKPYTWMKEFPLSSETSPQLAAKIKEKWKGVWE